MELIVDISEEVRVAITRMGLLRIPNEMQKEVDRAIQHGTPLDEIRERISLEKLGYPPSAGYCRAIVKVLQIIDNIGKSESEG